MLEIFRTLLPVHLAVLERLEYLIPHRREQTRLLRFFHTLRQNTCPDLPKIDSLQSRVYGQ